MNGDCWSDIVDRAVVVKTEEKDGGLKLQSEDDFVTEWEE